MYVFKRIWLSDDKEMRQAWQRLLQASDLNDTLNPEYTLGVFDEQSGQLVATGSFSANILQGIAVCKRVQSSNLLGKIVSQLIEELKRRNHTKFYVYTKPKTAAYFQSLGFHSLAATTEVVFMEFGLPSFESYIESLTRIAGNGVNGAIVMNANPFTKGHQYLAEYGAKNVDRLIIFVVSEDKSLFKTVDRLEMVRRGVSHLNNVVVVETKDYIVSQATFPSYFLKEVEDLNQEKVQAQATLDATLFKTRIAQALNIVKRFVGEEPLSPLTAVYNQAMEQVFSNQLQLVVIPRMSVEGDIISATKVRQALEEKQLDRVRKYVPKTTYDYITKKVKGDLE